MFELNWFSQIYFWNIWELTQNLVLGFWELLSNISRSTGVNIFGLNQFSKSYFWNFWEPAQNLVLGFWELLGNIPEDALSQHLQVEMNCHKLLLELLATCPTVTLQLLATFGQPLGQPLDF